MCIKNVCVREREREKARIWVEKKSTHRDWVYLKHVGLSIEWEWSEKKNTNEITRNDTDNKKYCWENTRQGVFMENVLLLCQIWCEFYQSGPLDLPPGGWNTRTLVWTFWKKIVINWRRRRKTVLRTRICPHDYLSRTGKRCRNHHRTVQFYHLDSNNVEIVLTNSTRFSFVPSRLDHPFGCCCCLFLLPSLPLGHS